MNYTEEHHSLRPTTNKIGHCLQQTRNLIRPYLAVPLHALARYSCFKPVNKERGFHPWFVYLAIVLEFCQTQTNIVELYLKTYELS